MGGKTAAAKPSEEVQRQREQFLAQFYTKQDILALLNDPPVCEKTFRRMIERGEFNVAKTVLPGRRIVWRKDLVNDWFERDFLPSRTVRPIRPRRTGRAS